MIDQDEQATVPDYLSKATVAAEAMGKIIEAAGSSDEGKKAASNLGRTAVTLTAAVNVMLLPLAATVYAVERAEKYFKDQFQADLTEKAKHIPEDCIVEPKARFAAPAIQGLAHSLDEPELKEMFLKLIASSLDERVESHPAFPSILQQLSIEDALLLKSLAEDDQMPLIDLVLDGRTIIFVNAGKYLWELNGTGIKRAPLCLANLERLNLVHIRKVAKPRAESDYEFILDVMRRTHHKNGFEPHRLSAQHKLLTFTPLGAMLAGACIDEEYLRYPMFAYQID